MACPEPPPPLPSLPELLAHLAAVDPVEADYHREEVAELELHLAQAGAQLARAEAVLAEVTPDGTVATYDEWCLRSSVVHGARREVRLLGVDEGCLRELLERALFLAQNDKAAGRQRCRACKGSGEGPAIPGGISVDFPPCEACAGTGVAKTPAAR